MSLTMMVTEFHKACGYTHSSVPAVDNQDRVLLWTSLISEESTELQEALTKGNLVAVADGLADLMYVCTGAALAFGIPIDAVLKEVHRSNMTKVLTRDAIEKRLDGKVLRGRDFSPPQLEQLLKLNADH